MLGGIGRIVAWLLVGCVLTVFLGVYPRLASFPAYVIWIPGAIILVIILAVSLRSNRISWNRKAIRALTAKQLMIMSLVLVPVSIAWLPLTLPFTHGNPVALLILSVFPFCAVSFLSVTVFVCAVYFALKE